MIIKVPIYCEFESIGDQELPFIVESLNRKFTSIARKYKPENITWSIDEIDGDKHPVPNFKIITREAALNSLRKGK